VGENYEFNNLYPLTWWNAEYKEPTTKNDLGVDAVSRQAINEYIDFILTHGMGKKKSFDFIKKFVANLPPATPQEPKPIVEIDLYSVIKQKYIEREVLDKIRSEIDKARFVDKDTRICKNALASGLEVALQIIDKYKGETENT
jgi:5,10-methenyltetrahydromethanopterin hydrogenase